VKFRAAKRLQEGVNGTDPKSFNSNGTFSTDFLALCLDVAVFAFWWLKLKQSF